MLKYAPEKLRVASDDSDSDTAGNQLEALLEKDLVYVYNYFHVCLN